MHTIIVYSYNASASHVVYTQGVFHRDLYADS